MLAESAQGGGGSLSLEVLKTRSDVAPGVMVSRHGGMGRCWARWSQGSFLDSVTPLWLFLNIAAVPEQK